MALRNTGSITGYLAARYGAPFLKLLSPTDRKKSKGVLQIMLHRHAPLVEPYLNGFVWTAADIYDKDSNLNIRVDDIWLAILAQLQTQDLLELRITDDGTLPTFTPQEINDPTEVANRLSERVKNELINDELAGILMPDFSQTTPHDTVSAALLLRGKYCKPQHHRTLGDKNTHSPKRGRFMGESTDWDQLREKLAQIRRLRPDSKPLVNYHLHFLDRMKEAGKYHDMHKDELPISSRYSADAADPKR